MVCPRSQEFLATRDWRQICLHNNPQTQYKEKEKYKANILVLKQWTEMSSAVRHSSFMQ